MARVFSCGMASDGQMGTGISQHHVNDPVAAKLGRHDPVRVASGLLCVFAITSDGKMLAFGKGKNGRLGTGREKNEDKPVEIILPGEIEPIIDVSAGLGHGACVTASGGLYTWGAGRNGALGHGDQENQFAPKRVEIEGEFIKVACGNLFTLAVTRNGQMVTFGSNSGGVLGVGKPQSALAFSATPHVIEFDGIQIVDVSAGHSHAAAIDADGRLFTWGDGVDGCLGHGNHKQSLKPRQVAALSGEKVTSVSCSIGMIHRHTLCSTDTGAMYAMGSNYKAKLGNGTVIDSHIPTKVTCDKFVVAVAAGGIHSAAMCDDAVLTWGCGSDGRLGHSEASSHRYLYKEMVPRAIEAFDGRKVRSICASYYQTNMIV